MINSKYYNDIKQFSSQFSKGFEFVETLDLASIQNINRVVVCGMGGSSLYVEILNDYLATFSNFQIEVVRGYDIPTEADNKTLFVVASYSGNTEETISAFEQIKSKNFNHVIFTAGGKLKEAAEQTSSPIFNIPGGLQPRLSTGYFIAGLVQLLIKAGLIQDVKNEILASVSNLNSNLNEDLAKSLAKRIKGKVPIVYSTDNNSSIARVTKIKFNENSKTQAFWNFFPEVNHNEMVGFSNLQMNPFFLMFESKFTNERNNKRIEIFSQLMKEKGCDFEIIDMQGENIFAEMMNAYYLADHLTFYLAEEYGIDPEPVDMVEEFKTKL